MIKSYACKETQKIAQGTASRNFPRNIQAKALMRIERLDAAEKLNDLKVPPSHRLEKLKGNRSHQHSVRINIQWRLCFTWRNGNAYDVEIVDYH